MRPTRIVAALISLFLAAALPLVSMDGARASSDNTAVVEKAKTKVSINFAANGAKSFRLFGKVTPKAKKTVTLLRASKANGRYGKFRSMKSAKNGSYSFSGLKKEGFYKTKVGNTTSKVIHVCKGGCG
jgi:hypothetical protein